MPAYVIVEITIHDPETYEKYKALTPATIAAYGGRFAVRGGQAETLEGDGDPGRIVVLEFGSMEKARAWYDSEEYRKPKEIRQSASTARMILVDGAP